MDPTLQNPANMMMLQALQQQQAQAGGPDLGMANGMMGANGMLQVPPQQASMGNGGMLGVAPPMTPPPTAMY